MIDELLKPIQDRLKAATQILEANSWGAPHEIRKMKAVGDLADMARTDLDKLIKAVRRQDRQLKCSFAQPVCTMCDNCKARADVAIILRGDK